MSFNKSQSNQKFCKVCMDAGKSEAEYRSHYIRETRDPNSKIICPTLLFIECRYCFKRGHTMKYCSTFKNKNKNTINKSVTQPIITNKVEKKQINKYSCLYDSDDDIEIKNTFNKIPKHSYIPRSPSNSPPPKNDFPQLCAPSKQFQPIISNYVSAVIHPEIEIDYSTQKLEEPIQEKYVTKILPLPKPVVRQMKSWADDSSDDEDYNM